MDLTFVMNGQILEAHRNFGFIIRIENKLFMNEREFILWRISIVPTMN
jgi:hypothetical protein